MVIEAERYKREDEEAKQKAEAKNGLESYTYNMRNTLNDENLKDKIQAGDRQIIESKIDEVQRWLEAHQNVETKEYEAKQKELENVCNPIMMKIYQKGGVPNMNGMNGTPGGQKNEGSQGRGPTVEEVD
ncbi:unnamed protein product [Blepharisma stoltei]|uniref:Heat shock protein 70 n=1 Tax=Blepharisma stoltei TaxID=1481888 RepID=A0AAU9IQ33_9CILI|nr:unnamed protein product [Blepharisma stoltei]